MTFLHFTSLLPKYSHHTSFLLLDSAERDSAHSLPIFKRITLERKYSFFLQKLSNFVCTRCQADLLLFFKSSKGEKNGGRGGGGGQRPYFAIPANETASVLFP